MKMKYNQKIIVLILIPAVVIITLFIGLAWAKYISSKSGEATASIAKWSFKLVDGIPQTTDTIDFPITRTDSNTKINEETIAPRYIW